MEGEHVQSVSRHDHSEGADPEGVEGQCGV